MFEHRIDVPYTMNYFQKVFTVHQHKLTASSRFGQSKIKVIFSKL